MIPSNAGLTVTAVAALVAVTASASPATAAEQGDSVKLIGHRAVYDLKLAQTRGNRPLESVQGRILYDFSGNDCEGHTLNFRQVTELNSGEGKVVVSDLRTTTWEEGRGKSFHFNSENLLNDQTVEAAEGQAERVGGAVVAKLSKPAEKRIELGEVSFPNEHMRRIIIAAREKKNLIELPLYDGSDGGQKVYNTLSIIGQPIPPDQRKPTDAAADQAALAGLTRWPVTISYFERKDTGGEQTPAYTIAFETYDNGISRALTLDYGDFVLSGELTSLEIKETKGCP